MAILQENTGKSQYHLFDLPADAPMPPEGTHVATVLDVKDMFGVERRKFEKPDETEKVDLTAFLFGFRDESGAAHKIDSRPMRISGNEKSALFAFLKSLLGKSPKMGWDYVELKGHKCLLTVEHETSAKGTTYAAISSVSPLPPGYGAAPAAPAAKPKPKPAPAAPPAPVAAPVAESDEEIPF